MCIICEKKLPLCLLETAHLKPRCLLNNNEKIDKNIDLFGNLLGMVGEMKDVLDKSKSNGEIINEKYYFKAFSELKDLLKVLS